MSESKAVEKLGKVDIYKATFKPLRHTLSAATNALSELVVDPPPSASSRAHRRRGCAGIISGIAIAVSGLTKAQFDATWASIDAAEEFVTLRERTATK